MKKRFFSVLMFGIVLTSAATTELPKINSAGSGRLLERWIALHLQLVRKTPGLDHGHVGAQFTVSSVAVYEAIVGGDPMYVSLAKQIQGLEPLSSPGAAEICWQASANAALANSLRAFFAQHSSKIDSLESLIKQELTKAGYPASGINNGEAVGKRSAGNALSWLRGAFPTQELPAHTIPKGDGLWEPTPPAYAAPVATQLPLARTCIANSLSNAMAPVPMRFSKDKSSPFYAMVNEVYTTSKNLTREQRAIALFWDDYPDHRYYGGPGHWASILSQVIADKQLSLIKASEAFAVMNIVSNDASIGCFKDKYRYNLLRPVTYIRKYIDPNWEPLIVTPPHPEYPAAHATVSMAVATALTAVLGEVAFEDHTYDDAGMGSRSFKSFEEAAHEAGMSRLYGGIHYRPSTETGFALGKKIAANTLKGLQMKKANPN